MHYSEADGDDMGIVGSDDLGGPNSPAIAVNTGQMGQPEIEWKKLGYTAIDIYVDRDGTGWKFLATDTQPNYLDTHPLPPFGQSAIWKYQAVYRDNDSTSGDMSLPVSVTVNGRV